MRKILVATLLAIIGFSATAQLNTNRILSIGRNALYFEDYVLSIQYFNRVINVKPYLADPYYFRAIAKYSLDDMTGAEADCSIALNINPFMINAYNLRGIVRQRLHRFDEALADFEKGLSYEPDNLNLLLNSGISNINLKHYDEAIESYTKVLKYDSRNAGAFVNLGVAYINKGDTIKAISNFDKAIAINSYSIEGYAYRAIAYYQTKEYAKSLADFDKLILLKPSDASFYFNRALVRYQSDNLKGAFSDIDKVLELEPKNAAAYSNRGIMRVQIGDIDQAINDFSRVLAITPDDDIALFNRAIVYQQKGKMRDALSDLNIIIAKHPEFAQAYYQRSGVKRALGDTKGADNDYMTAYLFEKDQIDKGLANNKPDNKDNEDDQSRKKNKSTRHKGDNDIKKYDQMVVMADFGNDEAHEDKETIRGKVQNKDIIIDLEPVFSVSFYRADTLLPKASYYEASVEAFNNKKAFEQPLYITNREQECDGQHSLFYFEKINNYDKQIVADTTNTDNYFIRGVLYGMVMNYNNAISDYDKCLEHDKYDINALINRASVRFKMIEVIRNMDSDLPQMNSNVVISKNGNDIGKNKPNISENNSTIIDFDLIIKDLKRVIEVEPNFEFALYNIAIVQCYKKQFIEAEASLTQAININSDFAEAYFNRGLVRIYLGKEEDGVADLSKAGELGIFKAYNVIKRYSDNE